MTKKQTPPIPTRKRLTREERLTQLLSVAWQLVAEEGTDALSLGRLAEAAGITKPTVYDHFGTRHGLLAALYRDFDIRHNQMIDEAIAASPATLKGKAHVMASSYIGCVLAEGHEIPGVLAALDGSPELAMLKRQCQLEYMEKFRVALTPFAGKNGLSSANMWGMLGAADALATAAAAAEISIEQACDELYAITLSLIDRSQSSPKKI